MDPLAFLFSLAAYIAPVLAVTACVIAALFAAHLMLLRRPKELVGERRLGRQAAMLAFTAIGVALIVLSLPVDDSTKAQLLSILGLVLTGVLGVSSTTFVSNAMAGIMLHALGRFELGDFIQSQEYFGRITERGLFYTEIQTEDRDLITLPNLSLVTNSFKLIRSSGTIVSANVTLGYNVPQEKVRKLLLEAATQAELTDPFVHILDLGNFSVKYRIAGLLTDVKRLLTVRSSLRSRMLDCLHGANVEIVSPSFMTQRALDPEVPVLPEIVSSNEAPVRQEEAESVVFDKADAASHLGDLRKEFDKVTANIRALEEDRTKAIDEDRDRIDQLIEQQKTRGKRIQTSIDTAEKNLSKEKD